MTNEHKRVDQPYLIMLAVYALFLVMAFFLEPTDKIFAGLWNIITSRGVLITDYMAVGGVGSTLVNAATVGLFGIVILLRTGAIPNGSTIMALWLSVGFAMFGKNLLNMMPITFGVWLYSKAKREPFTNFTLVALLSATLSPVVSGISFHPQLQPGLAIPLGLFVGVAAGFIFPAVSSFTVRVHGGYSLYNMGFAGGLISTFIVSGFEAVGVSMDNALEWSTGNNVPMAIMLYIISAGLILLGLFSSGKFELPSYRKIMRHSGRVVTDFYVSHGNSVYFNMGVLCIMATTLMLFYGADLNGPTLGGIFTIVGFGAFGKHLRNVLPVIIGAIICTHVNMWDPTTPTNTLAILFSTGLAPIAGQFGWIWGIITGFLHVNTVVHIGFLNSGLNLYNNGYAAGFVALLLLPIIMSFQREDGIKK